jgi:hypothetical protein
MNESGYRRETNFLNPLNESDEVLLIDSERDVLDA